MLVTQASNLINTILGETTGVTNLVNEDLSNIVDIGRQYLSGDTDVENFTRKISDVIGKTIFVNRAYEGLIPNLRRDKTEYGSAIRKIRMKIPETTNNPAWSLVSGNTYEQDDFLPPEVSQKIFNREFSYMIEMSFAEKQAHSAFNSPEEVMSFINMIESNIENTMRATIDALSLRCLNNFAASTINDAFPSTTTYTGVGNNRAVNLLARYNAENDTDLTVQQAFFNPQFLQYCSFIMSSYLDRLRALSTSFNIGGFTNQTPPSRRQIVALSDFYNVFNKYWQADTKNYMLTELPPATTVPYWQGSGNDFSFTNISNINVKVDTYSATTETYVPKQVIVPGVVAMMYDYDACGVSAYDYTVRSHVNDKGEFYTMYYKFRGGLYNDHNENFVVFYMA